MIIDQEYEGGWMHVISDYLTQLKRPQNAERREAPATVPGLSKFHKFSTID
ncbi:hypothetical protein BH20ACI2_BH20ACI2_26410 [soil metagenome]